ncbi:hypothetical protein D9X30_4737 [Cupriavidus sp. U2]|nr:hypothetical protein D9X30_4737 [Cupriavidus sp. U2]
MPYRPRPVYPPGTPRVRPEQEPYVIFTKNGQPQPLTAHAGRVPSRLVPGLILCLAMLSGCERNQPPGPGPKPISGSAATTTPTPVTNGASGTQAAPR